MTASRNDDAGVAPGAIVENTVVQGNRENSTAAAAPKAVPLANIERDTSIQCRASIDMATVNEYADRMTEGANFPPVALFSNGNGKHYIGDGWHRVIASEQIGASEISAMVVPGGRVAALKHALGANAVHGHRRTNEDKRRCAEIALREFADLSSRAIVEMCAVSHDFVARLREVSSDDTSTVTGTDGKRYPKGKKASTSPRPTTSEIEPTNTTNTAVVNVHSVHIADADEVQAIIDQVKNNLALADVTKLAAECMCRLTRRDAGFVFRSGSGPWAEHTQKTFENAARRLRKHAPIAERTP